MSEEKRFTPLSTEYDQTHTIFPEEFAEGPYGSPVNFKLSKDEWREDMHAAPRQSYEARGFHEGIPRLDPPSHATGDDPNTSQEGPYRPGIDGAGDA